MAATEAYPPESAPGRTGTATGGTGAPDEISGAAAEVPGPVSDDEVPGVLEGQGEVAGPGREVDEDELLLPPYLLPEGHAGSAGFRRGQGQGRSLLTGRRGRPGSGQSECDTSGRLHGEGQGYGQLLGEGQGYGNFASSEPSSSRGGPSKKSKKVKTESLRSKGQGRNPKPDPDQSGLRRFMSPKAK